MGELLDMSLLNVILMLLPKTVIQMIEYIKTECINQSPLQHGWNKLQNTKRRKTKNIQHRIGYPDVWRDHSDIVNTLDTMLYGVNEDVLVNVVIVLRMHYYKINVLDTVDKSQDPNKWGMNLHDVNAYYDPIRNEIAFTAEYCNIRSLIKTVASLKIMV